MNFKSLEKVQNGKETHLHCNVLPLNNCHTKNQVDCGAVDHGDEVQRVWVASLCHGADVRRSIGGRHHPNS